MIKKNGFTIIEMIAAIFIINIGIAAVFSLVVQSSSYVDLTNSRLIAVYLAQDGIEVARNIRDGNVLKMAKTGVGVWTDNFSLGADYYNFDYRSQSIPDNVNCSGKNYLQVIDGFYVCSFNVNAKFQRKIRLNQVSSDKIEITVDVFWTDKGKTNSINVSEILFNWY
ncbi:prepilin-type N-terminal cleavage/methylation domain-containing protein [Patescibacteria group bacterium]|nr:prepilin-type N-terminal cleavage/methylation domain-containing protein [Patescibacteria group bacterium]MBU1877212.1 prepilin-type N-terminal cleavage/methylation domain-containing protein [Patescibacteria group bacterium]